jgi:hypothetical protein
MRPLSASLVILWLAVEVLAPTPTAAQSESPEARELASLTFSSDRFDLFLTQAARVGTFPIKAALEGRLGRPQGETDQRPGRGLAPRESFSTIASSSTAV